MVTQQWPDGPYVPGDPDKPKRKLVAEQDAKRFAFLITNIKRYQLRESKGFWYYAPIASHDWQRGYRTAREAIDAAIERGEREGE